MASPLELQVLQLQCVLEAKDREIQQLRARMGQLVSDAADRSSQGQGVEVCLFDQQDLVDQLQTQLAQARAQAATHSPAQAAAPTPATTVAAAAAAAAAVQQPGVAQTSRAVPSVRVEQCKSLSHSAVQLLTRLQVELQQLGCELPSVGPAAAATGSTQQQGGRSPGQQQEGQQGGQQQGQGQGQQQGRQQQAQQGVQEQGQQGQEQGQAQQQGQGQAEGGSHPKGVSPEALVCLQRLNSLVGIQCGVEGEYSLSPKGASQTNASLQPSDLPTLQYLESVLGLNALWEDGADPPDVAWFITQQLQVAQRTNQDVVLWSDPQSGPGQPAVVAGSGKGDVQGGRGFQQHGPVQAAQGFNMYARMATLAANDA
ncbi:hypothetical protein QJQ45_002143 [Haematococcus lacustris]|nr:hypothetical protein QJQ45_002143 [Haematococcus lacustris]